MILKTKEDPQEVTHLNQRQRAERLLINGGWIAVLTGGFFLPLLKRLAKVDWRALLKQLRVVLSRRSLD